jgi:AcrR family transcriptional regulator
MNAKSRRHEHKKELRRAMLDAARKIFVAEGYENFSMRKLAEEVEYSPGSVYLYFKSKEELFRSLVEESFARLAVTLTVPRNGQDGSDPAEQLRRGLWTYVEFGLRNPNDYRFAFMIQPPLEKRPYKVHAAFEMLRHMVRRCVEAQRFPNADVETTAQALWASVHGITSLLIQRPAFPWVAKKKVIAQVINSAMDSLLAPPCSSTEAGDHHANASSL